MLLVKRDCDDTIKNHKALGKRNGYMNFKLKQRKKSTHAVFQNILKVALFELKKENEPFAF